MTDETPTRIGRMPIYVIGAVVIIIVLAVSYGMIAPGTTGNLSQPGSTPPPSVSNTNPVPVAPNMMYDELAAAAVDNTPPQLAPEPLTIIELPGSSLASEQTAEDIYINDVQDIYQRERIRIIQQDLAEETAAYSATAEVYTAELIQDEPLPATTAAGTQAQTFSLAAGTIIPGVLMTGINSEHGGTLVGLVAADVFDSITQEVLLIPQGSQLVGQYQQADIGSSRAAAFFDQLVWPSGNTIALTDPWPISDLEGKAGLSGHVNRRLGQSLGTASILGAISAGIQLTQPRNSSSGGITNQEIATSEVGRQLGAVGTEYARQGLSLAPIISVEPGTRFNAVLRNAVQLPPATRSIQQ